MASNTSCNDKKLCILLASYTVADHDKWLTSFEEKDTNVFQNREPMAALSALRVAGCETDKKDTVKTVIAIITYLASNGDKIRNYVENDAALQSDGLVAPSIMTFELLLDRWEIDPATLSSNEKIAVYIGGHGVLNFDSWLTIFQKYPHDKDFPGVIRTLAGKGPKHPDGTETCFYIHFFRKSYEKLVHQFMFGEEKKLSVLEHSVVLPYQPDIYADIEYMAEDSVLVSRK